MLLDDFAGLGVRHGEYGLRNRNALEADAINDDTDRSDRDRKPGTVRESDIAGDHDIGLVHPDKLHIDLTSRSNEIVDP